MEGITEARAGATAAVPSERRRGRQQKTEEGGVGKGGRRIVLM